MKRRWCAVSVDLDEIGCYRALHGLPASDEGVNAVYDAALERIGAFARAEGLPLSLFAVGADLDRDASAQGLSTLARAGHEVENHSHSHPYELTRLSPSAISDEVGKAQMAIERVTGRTPRGFRAPGYAIDDAVLDALEHHGLAYDASVLSSPPYYAAKAAVLAWMGLAGKSSVALLDHPAVLAAPRKPYRPGRPWYRRGDRGLLELPIAVTRLGGLPFIGTSVTLAGVRGARTLARLCAGAELVSLELHGIDFLGAGDGIADLASRQPDVRLTVGHKQRAMGAALDVLRSRGYRFITLAEAADALASEL